MDVRCVVPLGGHFTRHGHTPTQYRPSVRPIAKVGEAHNAIARHSSHFLQNALGVVHGLQGAREHDRVELVIVKKCQPLFQVLLYDTYAPAYAGYHSLIAELRASTRAMLVVLQVCEQSAVTATQVEHTTAWFNPAGDAPEIGAYMCRRDRTDLVHARTPVVWLRSRKPRLVAIRSK